MQIFQFLIQYCEINNCPISGSNGWLKNCRSIAAPADVDVNECLENVNGCDLFKSANCDFGPELGSVAGSYDLEDCQVNFQ